MFPRRVRCRIESVQSVFDYFCERTPRSYVERRETSLVWNYKFSDPEFGRLQARDLLQHLWTGPISNAPVDVIQGAKSVEVRPTGVSKGVAIERILRDLSVRRGAVRVQVDFALCIGHFLGRDEDIFTHLAEYLEHPGSKLGEAGRGGLLRSKSGPGGGKSKSGNKRRGRRNSSISSDLPPGWDRYVLNGAENGADVNELLDELLVDIPMAKCGQNTVQTHLTRSLPG